MMKLEIKKADDSRFRKVVRVQRTEARTLFGRDSVAARAVLDTLLQREPIGDFLHPAQASVVYPDLSTLQKLRDGVNAPTPFPEMKYPASATIEARGGYGVEWCRTVLGAEPDEIINTQPRADGY